MSAPIVPQEFVFKQVDGLDIILDVYLPPAASAESPASVLLWWHGGGLFQGTRKGCPPNMAKMPTTSNIAFISADYRFAPQTPLPLILTDCIDAVKFIRETLPGLLDNKIDSSKLAISGGSAGGWLALLAGIPGSFGAISPPPTCVIPIYPITDIETPFYTTKQHPVSYWPKGIIPSTAAEPHIKPDSGSICNSALDSPRAIVYHHTLQEAMWHELWFANISQAEGYPSKPVDYSITPRLEVVKAQGLTLPPMFVTMGSLDDKVDPAGPKKVAEQMAELGGEVVWSPREGKDHLFDQAPTEEMIDMHAFLKKHLL